MARVTISSNNLFPGPRGAQGPAGPSGGPEGPQGPEGPAGPIGPQGPQGIQGPTGPTGAGGAQGLKGDTGNTGAKGDTGDPGVVQSITGTAPITVGGTAAVPVVGITTTNFALLNTANTFTGGQQQITTASAATTGLVIRASASQTASLQEWQTSATVANSFIDSNGQIRALNIGVGGTSTGIAYVRISNAAADASSPTLVVRGVASMTGSLTQWQNSAGTVLGSISSSGVVTFGSQSVINANMTVAGGTHSFLSGTGGTVQINTTSNSTVGLASLYVGVTSTTTASDRRFRFIVGGGNVSGQSGASINEGTLQIREVVNSTSAETNRMTFLRGGEILAGTAAGSGSLSSTFGLTTLSASTIGLIVRGAASQTADLQQWQNSAGTVLSRVDNAGNIISLSDSNQMYRLNVTDLLTCGTNFRLNAGQSLGSGSRVMALGNALTVPSVNPTNGGILYVEAGALKYRGSSGTITTLGAA